jgi:hydrogenase assembly chaperone HypC/HupF
MCLGLVCELVELRPGGTAIVRHEGHSAGVSLLTLGDPVAPGDWLLVHSGFALARVTPADAVQARAVRDPRPESTT